MKSGKYELPRLMWIEWVDSSVTHGWMSKGTRFPVDELSCWTIGFVHSEDDDVITVAGSYSAHEAWSEPITIPKCAIKEMREVEFS